MILSIRGHKPGCIKSEDINFSSIPCSILRIFRKIEKDNCFIVQHIDNKAQFYCRNAGDDLYFAISLPHQRNYVYRRISVD